MTDVIIIVFLLAGSALILIAAIGVVRLPDLFTRMHAGTKSATLGVGCIMIAVALFFGELGVATRAFLVSLFFLLTAPVGAHLIGRAGYMVGVPLWEGTRWDELQDKYDYEDHTLGSPTSQAKAKQRESERQHALERSQPDEMA